MSENKDFKQYKCMNFGACEKANSGEIIKIATIETLGGIPECPCCHQNTLEEQIKKGAPWKLIGTIAAAVVVVLAVIIGLLTQGHKDAKPDPESVVAVPIDNDSIKASQQRADSIEAARVAAEQQRIKDSLDEATKAVEQEKNKSKHGQEPQPTNSDTKDLGYAIFKGTLKNGKPDAVNGRLIFKIAHLIDSRDSKQRMAEAGDYIIGEFSEGHLVQGIWYGADNQVKGSVIIGK